MPYAKFTPEFSRGDIVKWMSHGKGVFVEKTGMVVDVLRPNQELPREYWKCCRVPQNRGSKRKVVTYVIAITDAPEYARYYWPKPQLLRLVKKARKARGESVLGARVG